MGKIPAVGVTADLRPVAQEVERVLPAEHLEDQVGNHVREGQLHVAAHDVGVAHGPPLADPHAVEGSQDGVRQAVLLPGPDGEVLGRQLLEAVGRDRRGRGQLGALRRREDAHRFVDHRGGEDDDPLELAAGVGLDGGVEGGRQDPLVLREQVVGELVEVADPADHRGRRHDLVAAADQLPEEIHVLGVSLHQPVTRVVVVALADRAVLAEVVQPDDLVTGLQQLGHQVAVDEAGCAGDEDAHQRRIPPPTAPQTSTTSRPSSSRLR